MYANLICQKPAPAAISNRLTDAETSALDNALVGQKDTLIRLMNDAVDWADVGKLEEAQRTLALVTPLWESVSYGYKVRELRQRLSDCAWLVKVNLETAAQAHHRKGSKAYADMMARAARAEAVNVNNWGV